LTLAPVDSNYRLAALLNARTDGTTETLAFTTWGIRRIVWTVKTGIPSLLAAQRHHPDTGCDS